MSRKPIAWSLPILLALVTAVQAQPPRPINYVTSDAAVAVVLHPKQLLERPALRLAPREVLQALGLDQFQLDPLEIEQIAIFGRPDLEGPVPVDLGLALRFAKPVDQHGFPSQLVEGMGYASEAGNGQPAVWASDNELAPVFAIVEANTLLVAGSRERLAQMIEQAAQPPASPLQKALREREELSDLLAHGDLEVLRPLLTMALPQLADEVPDDLAPLLDVPLLLKNFELEIHLGEPLRVRAQFEANDRAAGDQVMDRLGRFRKVTEARLEDEFREAEQSDSLVEKAMAAYARRMSKRFFDSLWPKRQGQQLEIAVDDHAVLYFSSTAAIMLPMYLSLQPARDSARRAASSNNMKQLLLAIHNYEAQHRQLPRDIVDDQGRKLWSWRVHLLPFLEQDGLYRQLRLNEPWDSPRNRLFTSQPLPIFVSPNAEGLPDNRTHYLAPAGPDFAIGSDLPRLGFRDITDGLSNTVFLVEMDSEHAVPWAQPGDWQVDRDNPTQGLAVSDNNFLMGMGDGSIRFVATSIDRRALWGLFTRAGGEVISLDP